LPGGTTIVFACPALKTSRTNTFFSGKNILVLDAGEQDDNSNRYKNNEQMKAYMNWSGGKDSSLALYHALQSEALTVDLLFTSVNAAHNRVSMHGVRRALLQAQAEAIGLPLLTAELPEQPSMTDYEREIGSKVAEMKKRGYSTAVFGDIFLEDLKKYREEHLARLNINCVFPIWKRSTKELMQEFLEKGFKAVVVCTNGAYLDESFCGRLIDESFVRDLPPGVDVCGENGEYHSFVFDGPIFRHPISFQKGETVYREYSAPKNNSGTCNNTPVSSTGFYFCDILLFE
jgi:uncharacterized protein (TIGR00290 family)